MSSIPPYNAAAPGSRRFRLTRRHILGSTTALLLSSALPVTAHASREASYGNSRDTLAADGLAADARSIGWPPAPRDGRIVDVPYATQLDGSLEAGANCGPASLRMLFARFGDGTSVADIRWSVNQYMGVWTIDNGSSWEALANAAAERGYQVSGLYAVDGRYRRWTIDDLAVEVGRENPVMVLVRYRALPGHETSYFQGNHYVNVVGIDGDGTIVYSDPAFPDAARGAYLRMSQGQLDAAWSTETSGILYTGMVVKPKAK